MFLAAIVLLIAVTSTQDMTPPSWFKYGCSVASVTMIFSFIGVMMTLVDDAAILTFGGYLNYFLLIWNFAGAICLTFWGQFQSTGNGYFSVWAMVIFSLMGIGITQEHVRSTASGSDSLLGFFASSIIVLIAIIPSISKDDPPTVYAITLACLSVVLAGFFIAMRNRGLGDPSMFKFALLGAFAIMWIVLAFLVTFRGPFLVTGNGYFASWAGAVTSVFAAMTARP